MKEMQQSFFYQDFNRRFPEIIKPVAYLALCGENNQGLSGMKVSICAK